MAAPKNPNTAPARRGKAEKRRALAEAVGTLDDVRAKLWATIERVDRIAAEGNPEAALVLKASHALVQACGAYVKVLEVGEIEARLTEVEQRLAEAPAQAATAPLRRVS